MPKNVVISIDAMGGDAGPSIVVDGVEMLARTCGDESLKILLHGDKAVVEPLLANSPAAARLCELRHTDTHVSMTDKPSHAIRKARGSSMWNAIEAVKTGEAHACVSAGNTGALMVLSKVLLHMAPNAHRPVIAASWPTVKGAAVVLDIGANVECPPSQLVEFAIMGEAFYTALHGKTSPSIGLLNVGTEDLKGNAIVREADALIRAADLGLNYQGFIEGDGISLGAADVVVTDGFTGNVALKTAEGTAKLAAEFLRQSLKRSPLTMLGALLARSAFKELKSRMDPRKFNGGVFLGLGGVVVKSHGGTDGFGFYNAVQVALNMARSDYAQSIAINLEKLANSIAAAEADTLEGTKA
ncbi:MAG: phosphate acyltransferase [Robiginitomaculum sp.]|nr:MAG: phosphate acyltransferase [Robiginitomaculum sp.]